ncbi:hypothetical protein L6452_32430 [Arctium lappa]|uniref:Uncharacterized protein n=1 Tax=Arctium lappa TaxID=4217 RepID=A0ACB8Z5N9_ARCLA|nr:hypothetical protein L6452_32430 [Arctium lappa]
MRIIRTARIAMMIPQQQVVMGFAWRSLVSMIFVLGVNGPKRYSGDGDGSALVVVDGCSETISPDVCCGDMKIPGDGVTTSNCGGGVQ